MTVTANMNISEKYCLFVQIFETKQKRHKETVYYSPVKDKSSPKMSTEEASKSCISPFFFFFLKGYLLFLKQTQIGWRKMDKHM